MQRAIAESLLDIEAVTLRVDPPFTWASGRLAPIYCDNRLLLSHPERREQVAGAFAALLDERGWRPDVIAGTATAGIPHAAWLAQRTRLPMIYVRSAAKGHGKRGRIEGALGAGRSVVLVEDLISTGGSSLAAAEAIAEAGGRLLGVAAIFTYGLEVAARRFDEAGVALAPLTDFRTLMEVARDRGGLSAADKAILTDWQRDPAGWSAARGGAG